MNGVGKRQEKDNKKNHVDCGRASEEELGMNLPNNYATEKLIKSIPEKEKVSEMLERREL